MKNAKQITNKSGFTLLELLAVISLIGILATIAIPSYKICWTKGKVVELINLAESYKFTLLEELGSGINDIEYEYANPTKYASKIELKAIDDAYFIDVSADISALKISNNQDPFIIRLQAKQNDSSIDWKCLVSVGYKEYVPASCREEFS